MMKNENRFQPDLIREIKKLFPGCMVLKNDTSYMQGAPDLTILYKNMWAVLEVKKSKSAIAQPNQPYYVDVLNDMSFAAFIYPENKDEVLHDLQQAFQPPRVTCISVRK